MAFLFYLDESGHDNQESPYEVRCAVAVHDTMVWRLIRAIEHAETQAFGRRYSDHTHELKAKRLLKRKTFRLAAQLDPLRPSRRRTLARSALDNGAAATREQLTALAQAKLHFCARVLELCDAHEVTYFASLVAPRAPRSSPTMLRKDYSYLFQRLYYFLGQFPDHERGMLVMDELDETEAALLERQMSVYFQRTRFGRRRAQRIMPQPFFVHSNLTTGVQVADLAAYILSWNVRLPGMLTERRPELDDLGATLLRHNRRYRLEGLTYPVRSFVFLQDLRCRSDRDADSREGAAVEQLQLRAEEAPP